MMRNITKLLFIIVTITMLSVSSAAVDVGVAAKVNGEEILAFKLQKAVDAHLKSKNTNVAAIRDPKKYKKIRESVLDILIGQKLLWQAAVKDNITATDTEVNKVYAGYQAQYPNKEAFLNKMKFEGYKEKSYKLDLKQQLSARKWLDKKVLSKIQIDNKEIHHFYTENEKRFEKPEQIRASHILIKINNKSSDKEKAEAKKLLQKVKIKLNAGEDFSVLAKKYSQGPSSANGGDLGFFSKGKMVKSFENAVFKLELNIISNIVETHFGYHLIKVTDKKPIEKIREKAVANRIYQHLMKLKSKEALETTISKLKLKAKIEKNIF